MATRETKSPLKARPLRHAGQSLDEQIERLFDDKVLLYVLAPMLAMMLAAWEWFRWATDLPPSPKTLTGMAVGLAAYCAWRVLRIRRNLDDLRLGRDGERAVGEYLDRMRSADTRVLHDLVGNGFNIDHVLIAPQGIFAIETKTRSRPAQGEAQIHVSREGISVGGGPHDRSVVRQAAAQRSWLRDLLKESTGRGWPIRSVVLYPGWFVEPSSWSKTDDWWVLEPKALPGFVAQEPKRLRPDEVSMATFHLSRYIRTR